MNGLRNVGRLIIALAVAASLIAAALFAATSLQSNTATSIVATYRTGLVGRGDIEELVKSPSEVTARGANLTFQISGVVSDVLVKAGSVVRTGQVLAKLDTREAEANLTAAIAAQKSAQARLDALQNGPARELAAAQQNLKIAQVRLDNLKTSNATPEQLASAKSATDAAVYRFNALVSRPDPNDVAAAQANLRAAQARLDGLRAPAPQVEVNRAQAKINSAKQSLEKVKIDKTEITKQAEFAVKKAEKARQVARDVYDDAHNKVISPEPQTTVSPAQIALERQAKLALDEAELNYQSANKAYETALNQQGVSIREAELLVTEAEAALTSVLAPQPPQNLANAQAQVEQAQAELQIASAGPNPDEVKAAQADIDQARANEEILKRAGTDKDIQLATAEVDKYLQQIQSLSKGVLPQDLTQAQGGLEQATAQVKQAQIKIEQASLLAPYNSVIDVVNVTTGQTVSPGPTVVSLLDMSSLSIEVRVNEASIQQIKIGLPVRISFEGINGVRSEPFKGKVTFIPLRPKSGVGQPSNAADGTPITPNEANASGYPVHVMLDPNQDIQSLKVGMTGRARTILDSKAGVLQVPKIAVRTLDSGTVVDLVLPTGQIVTTPVIVGLIGEDYVEILENGLLLESDKLVLHSNAPVPPLPTPLPTFTPLPTPTSPPTPTPLPTSTSAPTVTPSPTSTPLPTSTSVPATPTPTVEPATPTPTPTVEPATPTPTAIPVTVPPTPVDNVSRFDNWQP